MIFRIALVYLYRFTIQAIFNAVLNTYHYLRLLKSGKLKQARNIECNASIDAMCDIPVVMTYKYDGIFDTKGSLGKWPCWTATRVVFAGMGMSGNCMDGAHFMARPTGGSVKVWIPDSAQYPWYSWFAHLHYVCLTREGMVWSLEHSGNRKYTSLEKCRKGGRWV